MDASDRILGLDIGGTKVTAVVGDYSGSVVRRAHFATGSARGFEAVFAQVCEVATGLIGDLEAAERPDSISVSIGGPLDVERGIILSPPNLPGWDGIPLKQRLEQRFAVPVYIEHDGNAGALAEWFFGAGRDLRNIVFLTMGTGLGAGLILDGRLYRGTGDLAGEVGHVRLAESGPTSYGKAGSWEGFCGGAGISQLAGLRFPSRWSATPASVPELARLARAGDVDAAAVFHEVAVSLGRGMAMLVDLLNPQLIVLGSLAVRLADLLLEPARRTMASEALPAAAAACRVEPAALGERLGDVAALCAAIHRSGGPAPALP